MEREHEKIECEHKGARREHKGDKGQQQYEIGFSEGAKQWYLIKHRSYLALTLGKLYIHIPNLGYWTAISVEE